MQPIDFDITHGSHYGACVKLPSFVTTALTNSVYLLSWNYKVTRPSYFQLQLRAEQTQDLWSQETQCNMKDNSYIFAAPTFLALTEVIENRKFLLQTNCPPSQTFLNHLNVAHGNPWLKQALWVGASGVIITVNKRVSILSRG